MEHALSQLDRHSNSVFLTVEMKKKAARNLDLQRRVGRDRVGLDRSLELGRKVTGKIMPDPVAAPDGNYVLPCNFLVGEWYFCP